MHSNCHLNEINIGLYDGKSILQVINYCLRTSLAERYERTDMDHCNAAVISQ